MLIHKGLREYIKTYLVFVVVPVLAFVVSCALALSFVWWVVS